MDSHQIESNLEQLGIPLNSTIIKLLETYPQATIFAALAALESANITGNLKNPAGFFVSAVKNGWQPHPKSQQQTELELLKAWFPQAKAAGMAVASMQSDDGSILILTDEDGWIPLVQMVEQSPFA
ncbi:hypothetical protein [Merismopedia glauca]|uniref:Uncharacterized protein n=1 Tax=Merismopedia glauca CCAP 1448/3 TaxID=1296344 RepID=A0A2T1BWU9_9CYAN|nr:hypothetical protein [Merismopedia glauca]PSB00387.1 hypothetical protein C7B64_23795 [Merismopedia glauca CCAP 1448/3]